MRSFLKLLVLSLIVTAGGVLVSPGRIEAFPSFSLTPASPGTVPGAVYNPAIGMPSPGGPQPAPVVAFSAASLGLPAGANIDDLSYGDDSLNFVGLGAGPLMFQFSVSGAALGGPWLPPGPNVFTMGVAGEGNAGSDIFATPAVIPPPFGVLPCGAGLNALLYDGDGITAAFGPVPGLGGLVDPPVGIAPFSDVDGYEIDDFTAVDYKTALAAPLSGPDGLPDAPIFFTVDPATAVLLGVSAADVLVTDPGSPLGWSIYATAAVLGLAAADNIDALLVSDSATAFPGPGGAAPGSGRMFGVASPTDFVAYSLAPGSPSLAPLSPLPPVCAPGVKTAGDVWGISPFFGPAPFAIASAESLGICSPRVAACLGAVDNLDAMDIAWAADVPADGAPDALEGACGALIGPPDTDLDGLKDSIEMALSTNAIGLCTGMIGAATPDSDFDGMIDSWEIAYWSGTCPAANPTVFDPGADFDGEGAVNIVEYGQFTSPCNPDSDADGFLDLAPTLQAGPANTVPANDNCPAVNNPTQANADGNFINLSPPKAYDDRTLAMSDAPGDACDADADNDGLSNAVELTGASCAGIATLPLVRDTDGDRIIDGAECSIGTNPTVITATPAACTAAGDADGDGITNAREFCYYGTSTLSTNSDGDACNDGREAATINLNNAVDVIDLQQVAAEVGAYVSPGSAVKVDFDMTKNGTIDVIDLQFVAARAGLCP